MFRLLGLRDGRRRTPRPPCQVSPLCPARALALCFLRPDPPPLWGRRGSGTFSTSRECPPNVTPSLYPHPFQHLSLLPWWPWHRSSWDPVDSPLVGNLTLWSPHSCPSSWWQPSPRPSPIVYLRCPITCLQLDAFTISLNVPSSVVFRMRPTWLALGLDQSPSSLLPMWYQFWSFRAAPPSQFRWGQRTDLSPRGRVPPIPEVPGRALTPDSSKRLHIHAVPSSSMPARPFLYTPPGDPHAPQ